MSIARKKRCFVISPIGAESSAVREHADEVFDFIIKPALDARDIEAIRSDHLREPGKISDQMFRAILKDDLCVAVLTGLNPNVFYELAIAQAAARPTIILIEKGGTLPFDIQDLRCVAYDLRLRSYANRTYIDEVIAHVDKIAAADWSAPPLFGVQPPLGGRQGGQEPTLYSMAKEYGEGEVLKVVQGATETIEAMGLSMGILRGKGFSEALARKAREGCKVRILFLHKENPAMRHMIRDTEMERRYEPKVRELDDMEAHFKQLLTRSPNIAVRQMRCGCPFITATRTEQRTIFIQHFYSEGLRYCPLWECLRGSRLYELIAQEFEALWQVNEALSDKPALAAGLS